MSDHPEDRPREHSPQADRPRNNPETNAARRSFLKLGLAGAGAAAAASRPTVAAAQQRRVSPLQDEKVRYSLTPHVERFYFLNRL